MATDHAPHSRSEKSHPAFVDIPGGMPGLQTLLVVKLNLVANTLIDLSALVRMGAHNPARRSRGIFGEAIEIGERKAIHERLAFARLFLVRRFSLAPSQWESL